MLVCAAVMKIVARVHVIQTNVLLLSNRAAFCCVAISINKTETVPFHLYQLMIVLKLKSDRKLHSHQFYFFHRKLKQ